MCEILLPHPLYTLMMCLGTGTLLLIFYYLMWQPAWCDPHHNGTEWCCKVSSSMPGSYVHAVTQHSEPSWHHSVIPQLFSHGSTSYWLSSNSSISRWVLYGLSYAAWCLRVPWLWWL